MHGGPANEAARFPLVCPNACVRWQRAAADAHVSSPNYRMRNGPNGARLVRMRIPAGDGARSRGSGLLMRVRESVEAQQATFDQTLIPLYRQPALVSRTA